MMSIQNKIKQKKKNKKDLIREETQIALIETFSDF